jgi:hypothetical protein
MRYPRRGIARGLSIGVRCSEACRVRVHALVTARDARHLGLAAAVTVGRGTRRISAGLGRRLVVRFTRAARRTFARRRPLPITLRIAASDTAGNVARQTLRVVVRGLARRA